MSRLRRSAPRHGKPRSRAIAAGRRRPRAAAPSPASSAPATGSLSGGRASDAGKARLRQAVAQPDFADVEIAVPKGWKATGDLRFLGDLTQDVVLEVRLQRTIRGAIVQRLFVDPYRLARRVLGRIF